MLLITGCPRSGTRSTSEALCASGLDIPHERLGHDGSVCWFYTVEDSRYPWGVPVPTQPWDTVFHQVRAPLDTIASLTTISDASWSFIQRHVPFLSSPLVDRCAEFWLRWNERVEAIASWRYRVEDAYVETIAAKAGLLATNSAPHPHRNRRRHGPLSWDSIQDAGLRAACQEMGERYGYRMPNDF